VTSKQSEKRGMAGRRDGSAGARQHEKIWNRSCKSHRARGVFKLVARSCAFKCHWLSILNAHDSVMNMKRTYALGKRAEQQAQTRQRIVEAAVDLHGTVGPAQTTVTMIAERAGVQRHTFYKHFPDERSLLMACSGLAAERDPMPEAEPWRAIGDREERLGTALSEVYAWFGRNAGLMACVTRDAQNHAL